MYQETKIINIMQQTKAVRLVLAAFMSKRDRHYDAFYLSLHFFICLSLFPLTT